MSNTDKVRPGVDANIVEANVVRGHDAILTGNVPEDIQLSPGRNVVDDTTSILTIWNRTDDQSTQVFDLRAGVDFGTAERAQVFVGGFDPSGLTPATQGSLFIRTDDAKLYQNVDGAMDWEVISDDQGGENLEETLAIGNFTGNNPIVVSNQALAVIQGEDSAAGTGGGPLGLRGGNETGAAGDGGGVTLTTGTSAAGNTGSILGTTANAVGGGASGSIQWIAGTADTGDGGDVTLEGGDSTSGGGGSVSMFGGSTDVAGATFAGFANIGAGSAVNGGAGGPVVITAGHGAPPGPIPGFAPLAGQGGAVSIRAGTSGGILNGGAVTLSGGQGGSGGAVGGNINLRPGSGGGGFPDGIVDADGILQADNIKRGDPDPNSVPTAGNEGDIYQRTAGGLGSLWVNRNGQPTGWEQLAFSGGLIDALTKLQQGYLTPSGDSVVAGEVWDATGLLAGMDEFVGGGGGSVSKATTLPDGPGLNLFAVFGPNSEAGLHMPNAESRTQRQHRFVAAFKWSNENLAGTDNRAFIGFSNLDGPTMIASDVPVGEYAGLMKRTAENDWRFLARGPAGAASTQSFAYSTTAGTAHYFVLDFSDPNGDDIVASVLDEDFNVIEQKIWTTTSGPDLNRGPASTTDLGPVVGIGTEAPGNDQIRLFLHGISVIPEADEFEAAGGGGGGGVPTLEAVLSVGNFTGDNSILLTDFDPTFGGLILGENDAPNNAPNGGRVSIFGGSTTNVAGNGGAVGIFSGFPAIGSATTSGAVSVLSGNVVDATNTGGTGGTFFGSGLTTGSGNSGEVNVQSGAVVGGDSGNVNLITGDSTGGSSGDIEITTGGAVTPGLISLEGGTATGGPGGSVAVIGGDGGGAGVGSGGNIDLTAGNPDPASAFIGGSITLTGTGGATTGDGGFVRLVGGDGGPGGGADGGLVEFLAGDGGSAGGTGGQINLVAGDATGGVSNGGDIVLTPGAGFGGGTSGAVIVNGKLTVTGLIDPTGMVFAGQAVAPAVPAGGEGLIWVDNTGLNTVLKFTDDGGTTITLGAGGGADLATVLAAGNSAAGQTITGGDNAAGTGQTLPLEGGSSTGGLGSGGPITLTTGSPDGAGNGTGGNLDIFTASGSGTGRAGDTTVTTGSGDGGAPAGGRGGDVALTLGSGGTDAAGGSFSVTTGNGNGTGSGGNVALALGDSGTGGGTGGGFSAAMGDAGAGSGGTGGAFAVAGGAGDGAGNGGGVTMSGGNGGAGGGDGGSLQFAVGAGGGGGNDGTFDVIGDATFSNDVTIANKLTVPLIDPIGVGFTGTGANPIAIGGGNDGTIWVNALGELIFTNSGGDTNISTGIGGGSGNFLDSLLESSYGMVGPGTLPTGVISTSATAATFATITESAGSDGPVDTFSTQAGNPDAFAWKASGSTFTRTQQFKAVFKFNVNGATANKRFFAGLTDDTSDQLSDDDPASNEYIGIRMDRTGTDLEFVARGSASAMTPQLAQAVDSNVHFLVIDATSTAEVVFTLLAADGTTVEATHTQADGTDIPSLGTNLALIQGLHSGDGGAPSSDLTTAGYFYSSIVTRADILPNIFSGSQNLASVLVNGNSTGGTDIVITPGDSILGLSQAGDGGDLSLETGSSTGGGGDGGDLNFATGTPDTGGDGGGVDFALAAGGSGGGAGGQWSVATGSGGTNAGGAGGAGGLITLTMGSGGDATGGGAAGGTGGSLSTAAGPGGDASGAATDGGAGGTIGFAGGPGGDTSVSGQTGGTGGAVSMVAAPGGDNTSDGDGGDGGDGVLLSGSGGGGTGGSGVGGNAGNIVITAAGGGTSAAADPGEGGDVLITAGDAGTGGTTDAVGGQVRIKSGLPGTGVTTTDPGGIVIQTEDPVPSTFASTNTRIRLVTTSKGGTRNGAQLNLSSATTTAGGGISLFGGNTSGAGEFGGDLSLSGGDASGGGGDIGGDVSLSGGSGDTGGNVVLTSGGGTTAGKIRFDGEIDPDGSAYKFGSIPDPGPWAGHPGVNSFTFAGLGLTPFPAGPPIIVTVTLEQPPGAPAPPAMNLEAVSATGFTIVFSFAPAAGSLVHWTARH